MTHCNYSLRAMLQVKKKESKNPDLAFHKNLVTLKQFSSSNFIRNWTTGLDFPRTEKLNPLHKFGSSYRGTADLCKEGRSGSQILSTAEPRWTHCNYSLRAMLRSQILSTAESQWTHCNYSLRAMLQVQKKESKNPDLAFHIYLSVDSKTL